MPIYIGSNEITEITIGSSEINEVWVGGNKVWDRVLETQTVTVGTAIYSSTTHYGYLAGGHGSISDGTFDLATGSGSNSVERALWSNANQLVFGLVMTHGNSGWTTMRVGGQSFLRTDASFVNTFPNPLTGSGSYRTFWQWNNVTTNPFGTTNGVAKAVEFI